MFLCRYLDCFSRAGLLLARDFTHLDHDALVSLGITATGHRKRILRLVGYIQRANQRADIPRDRCQSVSDPSSSERGHSTPSGPVNFEAFRNSSAPNLNAMLTNADSSRPVLKPVPKPRTVFNRRRTAPVHFCPTPDPAPPPPRRLSQESICFTVLEGLTSGGAAARDDTPVCRPSHERRKPSRSLSLSDAGGLLPPVPPRLNRGVAHATYQGSPPSPPPVLSCPGESRRLSAGSSSCLPRGGGMEMVSNDIYWGTLPGSAAPGGLRSYCNQQSAPPTPPRHTPDRTPERNRCVSVRMKSSCRVSASLKLFSFSVCVSAAAL